MKTTTAIVIGASSAIVATTASPTVWSMAGWPPVVLVAATGALGGIAAFATLGMTRREVDFRRGLSTLVHGGLVAAGVSLVLFDQLGGEDRPELVMGLPILISLGVLKLPDVLGFLRRGMGIKDNGDEAK